MKDLSLHVLDIVENSLAAKASKVEIRITEDPDKDRMILEIEDNGEGIPTHLLDKVVDPFFTTRSTRKIGLGLSLLRQAAQQCEGDLEIYSGQGKGTLVRAVFRYKHIDRKPLGDMASTLVTLLTGNADRDFKYVHTKRHDSFVVDTAELKNELGDIPINHPKVIRFVRDEIVSGLRALGHEPQVE